MPDVVSCLLMDKNKKILILKRSDKVRTYKGCWSAIAGYVEENERPIDTAFKEIREEVGLEKEDVSLIKRGDPIVFSDVYEGEKYDWRVFPFLFETREKDKIHIDWEHIEYLWISPKNIVKFDTVPHLEDVVIRVLE
jgi:8-oxo-dGTP pyrophosphatase MutT (NUDIX family)